MLEVTFMHNYKLKKGDVILYKEEAYTLKENFRGLYFTDENYSRYYLDELDSSEYSLKEKYFNKMEYMGAVVSVLSIAYDTTNKIIFLELFGQEDMVKSVSSVLMMGRTKMNDHMVSYTGGHFTVNKAGNKRIMSVLEKGLVHAIVYHAPSINEVNFNTLVGRDEEELLESFNNWMKWRVKSCAN